jgi:hypothetical protein
MNHCISISALLLFAALPPIGRAAIIEVADVRLTAFASYTTQGQPDKTSSDFTIAPLHSLDRAKVLVHAESVPGIPFPNLPTSQIRPFASSAADANGFFGVGVNGFFFPNALPRMPCRPPGRIRRALRTIPR